MSTPVTPWPDPANPGVPVKTHADRIVAAALQQACELPDRTSPDGQPDMLALTCAEFEAVVRAALEEHPVRTDADLAAASAAGAVAMREAIAEKFSVGAGEIIKLRDASPFHSVSQDALSTYARNLTGWADNILTLPIPDAPALATALEQAREAGRKEEREAILVAEPPEEVLDAPRWLFLGAFSPGQLKPSFTLRDLAAAGGYCTDGLTDEDLACDRLPTKAHRAAMVWRVMRAATIRARTPTTGGQADG